LDEFGHIRARIVEQSRPTTPLRRSRLSAPIAQAAPAPRNGPFHLRYHRYFLQRKVLRMTEFLPTLLWRRSPNFSNRRGTRVDFLVLHDCEGGYEGSVRRFELSSRVCRRTPWSARTGSRQRKWSTSPTMPGMYALSIGAPLASRWVGSRVVVLMRLGLQLPRVCSPFCAITYKFQSDMRALASDRVLPRTKISSPWVVVITIRPTTRASCRDLLAWSAMSIVSAISLRRRSAHSPKGVSAVA
jgi:hypothetical protein